MADSHESRDFYNTIARYYDAENEDMTADLPLYDEIAAETGGPILDVGCGTGRVMFHMAIQGYHVDGIDTSAAMLERARRKQKNRVDLEGLLNFYEGNALNFRLPRQYALILIPYNGLMHFRSTEDQITLLRNLAGSLRDDGLMVIDLPNAGETFATLDDGAVTLERSFVEPDGGCLVMQQSVSTLNRTEQLQYITWIYDEIGKDSVVRRTVAPLTLRYVFPAELELLLRTCGLRQVEQFGGYEREPFEEGCERMIVLAHKANGHRPDR